MDISKLILFATRRGYDSIAITAYGEGSLLKMSSSNHPGGLIGGGHILSAGGGSYVVEREQSFMDTLDYIKDEKVSGLMAIGWLVKVQHNEIHIFVNHYASGRRSTYEPATAKAQARRVA